MTAAPAPRPTPPYAPRLRPLPLEAVRIDDGSIFARARDEMLHLARVYPVDRLLAVFRANARLDTRGAQPPGTWEDFGHPDEEAWGADDYPGRGQARTANLLRGHYAGHFLSMLALAAAGTGEDGLRRKVGRLVAGLREVQDALAATGRYSHPGFLAAYGEWQFSRLEDLAPYGEIWAPYYTCHKIMAGLLDAYELVGNRDALQIATAMGRWVHGRLSRLSHERRQQMWSLYIAGEFGGMNETLARLSVVAGEPTFLTTAAYFDQDRLLAAGAAGQDVLDGMHANQHLPQLLGYVREYELTGDDRYLAAAGTIFGQVVPGRMFAHGGTGEAELWGPPDTVAGTIGSRNAETCATYNLLKLARALFAHTLDPALMDYYERGLVNHILGSRRAVESDVSPEVTYMFPVHPGALREYDNVGTCCGGTGLENHVKYQDTVAFEGADQAGAPAQLWLNQWTPAAIRWDGGGLRLRIDTAYPLGGTVRIRVGEALGEESELHLRIPAWLTRPWHGAINWETITTPAAPGEYLTVRRRWIAGDEIRLEFPVGLTATPTLDDPSLVSLRLGPTVLLARSAETATRTFPFHSHRLLDGRLRFDRPTGRLAKELASRGAVSLEGVEFEPCWSGGECRYHMYLRQADPTIVIAGTRSGVPNREDADGRTLLDLLWADGGFADREAFLDRVAELVVAHRRAGLLTRPEAEAVLLAAARADIDGSGLSRAASIATQSAPSRAPERLERDGFDALGDPVTETVWVLPEAGAEPPAPPAVRIGLDADPAPSGWYVVAPAIRLEVSAATGDVRLETRLDDGPWEPYEGAWTYDRLGTHRLAARVTDGSGRTGWASREISLDTEPPTSRAVARRLGNAVEVILDAADDVSGLERIQWQGPGTFWGTYQEPFVRTLTDTEQVLEYAATDRAGNREPVRTLVLPALDDPQG